MTGIYSSYKNITDIKNTLGELVIVLVSIEAIHYAKLPFQSSSKLSKIRIRKFEEETLI